jgi:hypothetical protein
MMMMIMTDCDYGVDDVAMVITLITQVGETDASGDADNE